MQVAGSASGTHKHDGDNTTECFKIIFVNVVSGTNWREGSKQETFFGGLKTRSFFMRKIKKNCQNGINNNIQKEKFSIHIQRNLYQEVSRAYFNSDSNKKTETRNDVSLDSNVQANKILSP